MRIVMRTVNKNNFKLEDYLDKEIAINCNSEDSFKDLQQFIEDEVGDKIGNRAWKSYGTELCINLETEDEKSKAFYASTSYYNNSYWEIVKWEIIKEENGKEVEEMKVLNRNTINLDDFIYGKKVIYCNTKEKVEDLKNVLKGRINEEVINKGYDKYGSSVAYKLINRLGIGLSVSYDSKDFYEGEGYTVFSWEVVKNPDIIKLDTIYNKNKFVYNDTKIIKLIIGKETTKIDYENVVTLTKDLQEILNEIGELNSKPKLTKEEIEALLGYEFDLVENGNND